MTWNSTKAQQQPGAAAAGSRGAAALGAR